MPQVRKHHSKYEMTSHLKVRRSWLSISWILRSSLFNFFLLLFSLNFSVSCSSDEPSTVPKTLFFSGAERIESARGGMWRLTWTPLVAVDRAFYSVFEREEHGGVYDFNSPLARARQQFYVTKDLRLSNSRCYTVQAIVEEKVVSSSNREVCTGHSAFSFTGVSEAKPLQKGNYLLNWPLTPYSGKEMSFEISERRKGDTVWNAAGSTAKSFFPTRPISIDEVVCFNVRYVNTSLPKDSNSKEVCTDEETTGNFTGIKSIKKAPATDPLEGYIIEWEPSVRDDVTSYRVYMGADFKKMIGEVSGKERTFRVSDLAVGATYEFGVRLLTADGREDGNLNKLRVTIENELPIVSAVDLRGVRRIDPETGENKVSTIRCTADFVDPDKSSGRLFPKIEFKARLATGERPVVLRKRLVMPAVTLDAKGRATASAEYELDPAKDRRGNDLFCEATVFDGIDSSATVPSQFVFLPDSPGIATGLFISKKIYFDPKEGSTHYYASEVGGEPAQVLTNLDGTRSNHSCMISTAEGNIQNENTLDICEDTSVNIIIKKVRVPEELQKTGNEEELAAFERKMNYQEGELGDDYALFFADLSNRAKSGYWDPDAGDLASAIQFRETHNGSITSSVCVEGVCELNFKFADNFASGSAFSDSDADGQKLVHAQFEYRVRTYDPGQLEGFDINGTPVDEIGWSNWAQAKIDVTGVDEEPRTTGMTVRGVEDRVQKIVFCNDLSENSKCLLDKAIEVDASSADPMLKYQNGKGFGYFDLEDDPPVRVLPQSAIDPLKGQWVKPKTGITVPNVGNPEDWQSVSVPLSAATACDQTKDYCPFTCSKSEKMCFGYFMPAVDRTSTIQIAYDVWVEVDLTTNPDAQYFGKPDSQRQVKSLESGMLHLEIAPLNDKPDVPEISTVSWREDEVGGTAHQIKLVPTTGYVNPIQEPNTVQYFDPDGDLIRRATDIEVRFWESGQLKTSYCRESDSEKRFSGSAELRLAADRPGVRGVTTANCQMDIGTVVYRPEPPHVDANKTLGIAYNAKLQWVCDGSGNCSGNILVPEHYNFVLGNKPIEFQYRVRTTRLDPVSTNTIQTLPDDFSDWKSVSLKINPEPDAPMALTISLGGEDSNRKAISEDEKFVVRLASGAGVARNLTVPGANPEEQRHYDVYFDVDETEDIAYEISVVEIYKKDGTPVIFDASGNDISASLPLNNLFTCDGNGVCTAEFTAAENFFTPDGQDAFFKVTVKTHPKNPSLRAGNQRESDPALAGRVSFTIAAIDDAPSTGGSGVMSGIPEDETFQVIFKKNPAEDEFGYIEVEAGDLAEKIEFTDIRYYDPFYQNNETLLPNPFPDPIKAKNGNILSFLYGSGQALSGVHGFPGNGNNTDILDAAPSALAINRSTGLAKKLIVRGEYFASGGGASPTLVPDINVGNYLLPAEGNLPERYQYVCRRTGGSGLLAGQCKVEIRSPLHFNTDNSFMSGRTASMSYRIYTRDANRWKSPYGSGQDTPSAGAADESNGKWSEWKYVDLLFSPVNDPPSLISPLKNELLTWENDLIAPGVAGADLKGGNSGNNTATNRAYMIEDLENKLYFRWRKTYTDLDYHTESFTFNFDRATQSGNWFPGSFSNARRFLATKLSINLDSITTAFWKEGQPSIEASGNCVSFDSLTGKDGIWCDSKEMVSSGNTISRTRSFSSEIRETGAVVLAVNGNINLTHNLGKDLGELNFSVLYQDNSTPPQMIFLSNWEAQKNFTLTQISDDVVNIVRTGNNLFNGLTFGDTLNLRVAANGWINGNPGDYFGPPATGANVTSASNINCDDQTGDCIFFFQPPPNFSGKVDATVRLADGNPYPQSTDWNDELNTQRLYIFVENQDDLPQIVVPEQVVDIFETEPTFLAFARLSNGVDNCKYYQGGVGNPYFNRAPVLTEWGVPLGVQDEWTLDSSVFPPEGCQILFTGYTTPAVERWNGTILSSPTFMHRMLYTFLDGDREEATGLKVTTVAPVGSPRFELSLFGSGATPNGTAVTLNNPVSFNSNQLLRVHAPMGSANSTYNFGMTSGKPYSYTGDPDLGDAYFDYQIKTSNLSAAETNTVDCSDPAACFSNTGRVYVRIHPSDHDMVALNPISTTVGGATFNVAQEITIDEDTATTLSVTQSHYQDVDLASAPYDKAIGIKRCGNEVFDKFNFQNTIAKGQTRSNLFAAVNYEDFDSSVFEWSPDIEFREDSQNIVQGSMADPKMSPKSFIKYSTLAPPPPPQGAPNNVPLLDAKVSKGTLLLTGGTPQAFMPQGGTTTLLTENNGLSSACGFAGATPTGNCSMQIRSKLNMTGEFLVCVHVKSFAQAGDKFLHELQWSDPIYFKVTINKKDDPPRIGQLAVRVRGNEDHQLLVEVRPQKFEWIRNNNANYVTRAKELNDRKMTEYYPSDNYMAIRPGYWDFDSNMDSGSDDLAEFLFVNMSPIANLTSSGIGNGAIAHPADPDSPNPSYDIPCKANVPATNICKIKCAANGFCSFKFTPPVHNDSDFTLEYWVQSKGGKKLSSRLVDNTPAARGGDVTYAPYEHAGEYDNYPYFNCINEESYKLNLWRYALEEPRMPGTWGSQALYPVTEYGSGIGYYDQLSPPPAARTLPNFYGYNDERNIVIMNSLGVLSSFEFVPVPYVGPVWVGPGIPEKIGTPGLDPENWLPPFISPEEGDPLAAPFSDFVFDYMTNHIVFAEAPTANGGPGSSAYSVLFPATTVRKRRFDDQNISGSYASGGLGLFALQYPKVLNRSQPQGPPAGTIATGGYYNGCEQRQTGYIKIEIEPVPDKPATPAFINRTISGRLANQVYIGNSTTDPSQNGYVDGDGDSITRLAILGNSPANPQWSITTNATPPATPTGLTLLERFPATGTPSDGSPVRYLIKSVGTNSSGPEGCNSGGGFCRFYFHPAPGFVGSLNLNYTVTTGNDAWESDDGVNPLVCAGNAFGKSCTENAPGELRLSVVSNAPTITLPATGQPFQISESGGPQPLRLNGSATQAQFLVDEGGGEEQDPERVVVWFSGCDEVIIKCANISFGRTDAAYGSLASPANNMGAANATIIVQPEPNRFTTPTMNVTMHAEEYDGAGNPTGYETTRTIPIQVLAAEDAPTISLNPLSSPAYVANEDTNIVITNVTVDEGGGVDEDSQQLTVSFVSADQSIVPNGNIVLSPADESGGGAAGDAGAITNRTITITPAPNANTSVGGIKITMTVADGVSAPTTRDFYVQFNGVDDPPALTSAVPLLDGTFEYKATQLSPLVISGVTIDEGGNPTGIGNEDSQVVSVQFISSDTSVINPDTDVSLNGASDTSGSNSNAISRTLTITPSGFGQDVLLTMRVSDGANTQDFIVQIDVTKPPLGPLECTDSSEANPDVFVIGSGRPVPPITCSGLTAASAPGTGAATYEIDASSTCTSVTLATNGGAGSTTTLGGTMSTLGDCSLIVSGNDTGTPIGRVPLAQRKTLNFQIAMVSDLTFSAPTLNSSCNVSVDLAATYYSNRSSFSSAGVIQAAATTNAISSLSATSSKVTGVLTDFTKTTDSLDVTVSDNKSTSRTETLALNISKSLLTGLAPTSPSMTPSGTYGSGKQARAASGTDCVNTGCESELPALIGAGDSHTCALGHTGILHCWGENDTSGKLGLGSSNPASSFNVPQNMEAVTPAISGARALSVGKGHSCLVTNAGALYCWGNNSYGQLATALTTTHVNVPTLIVAANVASVAVGENHTCYLKTDKKVFCAGRNNRGQLGDGLALVDSDLWKDAGFSDAIAIAAAGDNTCALTGSALSRSLFCWGDNTTHQLGSSAAGAYAAVPTAVDAIPISNQNKAVDLAMGGASGSGQVCIITSDAGVTDSGTLRCFGNNSSGQLARNPSTLSTTGGAAGSAVSPTLPSSPNVVSVTMGAKHTCLITTNRKLYCYGEQESGRLGNGLSATAAVFTPYEVSQLSAQGAVAVSAGSEHTCATGTSGTPATIGRLSCFGKGAGGRIGHGLTTNSLSPVDLNTNTIPFLSALRSCYKYLISIP